MTLFHIYADETPPWYLGLYEANSEAQAIALAAEKNPQRSKLRAKKVSEDFLATAKKFCSITRWTCSENL